MGAFGPGMTLAQMPPFVPGKELCGRFYREAVCPILQQRFSGLPHAAALLDFGSDVLGFDTPLSRDHGWGPRCTLFLRERDYAQAPTISAALAKELPLEIGGYPTNFHNWVMAPATQRPIRHLVQFTTVGRFFRDHLGVDATQQLQPAAWLTLPAQRLRTIQSGTVYHDGLGELTRACQQLSWYPHDVWLYLLACQWRRIEQEEPFMARCADAGDELGSRLVAARQVQEIMRLCFLIERQYPPYTKWFGTAFARLNCAAQIGPFLRMALEGTDWHSREEHLLRACVAAARHFNALGITPPLPLNVRDFYNRPYRVLSRERFAEAIRSAITSPAVQRFPEYLGAIWQFADSTDVLDRIDRCSLLGMDGQSHIAGLADRSSASIMPS